MAANSPSTGDMFRSPILGNVLQYVQQGQDKVVRQAFYNTAASLFVAFVIGAAIAVFYILEAFLRPLLWAVLCGTFLHPFKQGLTGFVQNWLSKIRMSNMPLVVATTLIPVKTLDTLSELLGAIFVRNIKVIAIFCALVTLTYLLYQFAPIFVFLKLLQTVFNTLINVFAYFTPFWLWTLTAVYVVSVVLFWTKETQVVLQRFSVFIWLLLLFKVASLAGTFRLTIIVACFLLMIVGAITEFSEGNQGAMSFSENLVRRFSITPPSSATPESAAEAHHFHSSLTPMSVMSQSPVNQTSDDPKSDQSAASKGGNASGAGQSQPSTSSQSSSKLEEPAASTETTAETPLVKKKSSKSLLQTAQAQARSSRSQKKIPLIHTHAPNDDEDSDQRRLSDTYFMWLFWAIVTVRVWLSFEWVWKLMPILIGFLVIKRVGAQIGMWAGMRDQLTNLAHRAQSLKENERLEALVPRPVRGVFKLCLRGDSKVVGFLENSMDKVVSILVIMIVLVGMVLLSFFMAIQVNRETMHLVTVSSSVLNNTMNYPELHSWMLSSSAIQDMLDQMAGGDAYMLGREFITQRMRGLLSGDEKTQKKLEKPVLELWDKLYEFWFPNSSKKCQTPPCPQSETEAEVDESEQASFLQRAKKWWVWDLLQSSNLLQFLQQNIGLVMSVSESVWIVLKSNVSLVLTVVNALFSLVFGGGTAILNFILSIIVFITTLFYLLALSTDSYLPMEWFYKLSPARGDGTNTVEEAISSVFKASLKMALFYGGYTWLTHTVFGIKIVFIPSALAALFGAVPFLGTYWAALPAVVELWLVHAQPIPAILLITAHLLPTYFVDTAVYSEIKGGHAYLTGLAIAGGIYWMGLEGAIIGPILLCSLLVAVNTYTAMITPEENTSKTNVATSEEFILTKTNRLSRLVSEPEPSRPKLH